MTFKDRVKSLRRVKASELIPHPDNWRTHPDGQLDAMSGMMSELGYAGAALAIETKEGLMLIDGHARAKLAEDEKIPVLVLDLTMEEGKKLLATYDTIGGMAQIDAAALDKLLNEVQTESESVMGMLEDLAKQAGLAVDEAARPDDFKDLGDEITTEHKCPKCGYEW